jgi:hypothetical protein
MNKLVELPVGVEGLKYVSSCLQQGRGLCSNALRMVKNGSAFAVVPDGTSADRAKAFVIGGLMSRMQTKRWLVNHIVTEMQKNWRICLVIQDIWARPSDERLAPNGVKVCFSNDDVYYIISRKSASFEAVMQALEAVSSFLFIAALVHSRSDTLIDCLSGQTFSNDVVKEMTNDVRELFVSAYDQEGMVVWRKDSELQEESPSLR